MFFSPMLGGRSSGGESGTMDWLWSWVFNEVPRIDLSDEDPSLSTIGSEDELETPAINPSYIRSNQTASAIPASSATSRVANFTQDEFQLDLSHLNPPKPASVGPTSPSSTRAKPRTSEGGQDESNGSQKKRKSKSGNQLGSTTYVKKAKVDQKDSKLINGCADDIKADADLFTREICEGQSYRTDLRVPDPSEALEALWAKVRVDSQQSAKHLRMWQLRVTQSLLFGHALDEFAMKYVRFAKETSSTGNTLYNVDRAFRRFKDYAELMLSLEGRLIGPRITVEEMKPIFAIGAIMIFKHHCRNGSTLFTIKASRMKMLKDTNALRFWAFFMHLSVLKDTTGSMQDEGVVMIEDEDGFGISDWYLMTKSEFNADRRLVNEMWHKSMPMRFNRMFIMRQGWAWNAVWKITSRFMDSWVRDQVQVLGWSNHQLESYFDPASLPICFLGGTKMIRQCPEFDLLVAEENERSQ